ncbi:hypothetical protein FEI10_04735, partial [Lacticaseibacillus casei]
RIRGAAPTIAITLILLALTGQGLNSWSPNDIHTRIHKRFKSNQDHLASSFRTHVLWNLLSKSKIA